jgi:N-ethylmaleimide reductase
VRISPLGTFNEMGDDDAEALFRYVAGSLNEQALAYLHVVDPAIAGNATKGESDPRAAKLLPMIRNVYSGVLMLCGGYDAVRAEACLVARGADLIAFGRSFLANPDLPERFRLGSPTNPPDEATFYGGGAKGYIDYPTWRQMTGEDPMPDLQALAEELLMES